MKPILDNLFQHSEDKVLISTFSGKYNAKNIMDEVHYFVSLLEDKELKKKRVGVLVPKLSTYVALTLAINKLGGTVVPISWQLRKEDLTSVLQFMNPHIVFSVDEHNGFPFGETIENWAKELKMETILYRQTNNSDWSKSEFVGENKPLEEHEITFICTSSGSTGTPKGLVLSADLLDHVYQMLPNYGDFQIADNVLINIPPTSFLGTMYLFYSLHSGTNMLYPETFDFPKMVNLMEENNCNKVISTPSIFKAIYQVAKGLNATIAKNIELVGLGGENVQKDYISQFEDMNDCVFLSLYGTSEAGALASCDLRNSMEFTLVDNADYVIKDGELLTKSKTSFVGYYKNPQLNKEIFDENGFIHTGDIVKEMPGRKFVILGRKKDMIKKGGQQVIPGEVENVLEQHSSVERAVVLGAPHAVYGEQIVAFIIANQQTDTKELSHYCTKKIAGYKVPDQIIFIEEVPMVNGKVDKVTLKKMYLN
ncbi:class I adenylate-forming enzyme family protein [Salirhabdus sp. Marseille-P4669]|uniref:class I adenylate-forming enzyme family protein n=1 Tax=Salirhabdus sp. Marseille-P4669 TaxID=2042310 RepID=UPI000C7D4729|nr:class I adenylate-forming enzyme family protein [Salirhabdus sp. Marseille-P4669]